MRMFIHHHLATFTVAAAGTAVTILIAIFRGIG